MSACDPQTNERTYLISLAQPPPPSPRTTHGIGNGDFLIMTDSPELREQTSRPSTLSSAGALAISDI
jgi:hypothetical protein